jgi:hypothetical protein
MRFRHRTQLIVAKFVVVALPISFLLIPASAAQAEVPTCGTASNWFDGYFRSYSTGAAEGANASIITQYGAVCDTNTSQNNFGAAWAMIAGSAGSDGWVQSGFIRWYNHVTVFFSQISRYSNPNNGGQFDTRYGMSGLTYGSANHYYEKFDTSCACLRSSVNSTLYLSSTFSPYTAWTYPFSPQFFGETAYRQSDMPGNASSPTSFSKLQYQNSSDNWVNFGCNVLTKQNDLIGYNRSDGYSWYDQITNCPDFNIYTAPAGG